MNNQMNQPFTGKSLFVPFWVLGLASLLVIALWWSGTSTVLAQEGGDGESELSGVSGETSSDDDGTRADEEPHESQGQELSEQTSRSDEEADESQGQTQSDEQTLRCIFPVLGRVPTSADDLTDDEKLAVSERCFSRNDGAPEIAGQRSDDSDRPGSLNEDDRQCIISVLGRMPEGPDDLNNDEKRLLGQQCFPGRHDGGSSSQGRPGITGDLDAETLKCIVETIGRLPMGPDDLTNDGKLLVGQACFGGGHQGPGRPDDLDEETLKCIVNTIGRLPSGPNDLSNEEERLIGQACFGGGRQGPGESGDLDEETLNCIVDTIGRLPSGPDDLSLDEKRLIGQAYFGGNTVDPGTWTMRL